MGRTDDNDSIGKSSDITAPADSGFDITPHDTNLLEKAVRGIHIGVGGDLAVVYVGDESSVVLKNLQSGEEKAGRFARVLATGTTCTDLVGLT